MKRSPILIAATAALFLVACKNSATSGLPIPKDAAMVLDVNTSSLTSKLNWDEIKSTSWFQHASEDAKDSVTKQILQNPSASGIDMKSDLVYFIKKQNTGGYMVFEGKLKDASAFETMIQKINKNEQVQKDGDVKWIKTGTDNIVSWNDSKFIAMSDAPFFRMSTPFAARREDESSSFSIDSLRKFTKDILALNSDNSLEKDNRFTDVLKDGADVHFWMNTGEYISSFGGGYLSMLKINDLLQDNASAYSLSFDNGKIDIKAKSYYGKAMSDIMSKFSSRNVDAGVINRIPSQNIIGVMAMNFDPGILKEFLKASGLDGMANGFLQQAGLSTDELVSAFKGEFLFALTDLNITKTQKTIPSYTPGSQPYTYTSNEPDFKMLFAASVANKSTFDKLINVVTGKMKGEGVNDTSKITYKVTNDWFAISNKADVINSFLAGSNNKVPVADKLSGHPFGLYIDLQKAIKSDANSLGNATDSAVYDASIKMWQDVLGTGGEYKNGVSTMEITINLMDKNTNSLKQLNAYADKMYAAHLLTKNKYDEADTITTDSTAVTPAPVEIPKQQ